VSGLGRLSARKGDTFRFGASIRPSRKAASPLAAAKMKVRELFSELLEDERSGHADQFSTAQGTGSGSTL
jgi:hypothetical protein